MSNIVVKQINGGPTGVINAIINGNFGINQRGVSGTVTLASGVYGHDRWKAGSGGCTYTFATVANVTTLTISAGTLIQVIEGLNLSSGTYTLSFTGTAQGKIGAGSFAGSGVTGTAVGGTNLNIEFNTGTVSLVQFELGSVATPFERRPFGAELALCQRYCQMISAAEGNGVFLRYAYGECTSSTGLGANVNLLARMRITPALTTPAASLFGVFSGGNISVLSSISIGGDGSSPSVANIGAGTTGLTTGRAGAILSNSNNTSFLLFTAEL